MVYAEDKMWDYLTKNIDIFHNLEVIDLLDHLLGCLTQPQIERIRALHNNVGNSRSAFELVDSLRKRPDWVDELIRALKKYKRPDIAEVFQTEYDKLLLPSQRNNIPPPSRVSASPQPPQTAPLPTGTRHSISIPHAQCFQLPSYSEEPAVEATPSGTQPQPLPPQQAQNSSTATGATVPPFTLSQEDIFEATKPPTQSQQAGAEPNTNLTQPTNSGAVGFQDDPHLIEAVSNPGPRDPMKGDFGSRLSQEETDPYKVVKPTADDRKSFTPFNLGPGRTENTDRVVRRKELAGRNGAQNEPSDDHMGKAKRETPARPLDPPTRIQDITPSTHAGVLWRMNPGHGEEEEYQAPSKPGVLTSVQPSNPAPQSSDSPRSSMHSSRLAISSVDSPPNESTLRRQQNEAHPGSINENTTDYQQGRGGSSSSSGFTVRSDPLFISRSSTGDGTNSMEETGHYEFKFSKNPSIGNYDTPNPVRSLNTVLSGGANSQENVGNENRNNNEILYEMVLTAIVVALVGVFLLYISKQT